MNRKKRRIFLSIRLFTAVALLLTVGLTFSYLIPTQTSAAQEENIIILPEAMDLGCGQQIEEYLEFEGPRQVITYRVFVPPEAELLAYVKDAGQPGDIWEACINKEETETANLLTITQAGRCTQGNGSFEYASPASLMIPDGEAFVSVRYLKGINNWPAHMYLKLECNCLEEEGKDVAVDTVIREEMQGEIENKAVYVYPRPLFPGEEVANWAGEPIHVPHQEVWYVFVDDHVNANFEHPTRHVFVNTTTGMIEEVIPATTPPRELFIDMELVAGGGAQPNVANSAKLEPAMIRSASLPVMQAMDSAIEVDAQVPTSPIKQLATTASASKLSVKVSTNKPQYKLGETVTIKYSVNKFSKVKLTVKKPDGSRAVEGPKFLSAGTYSKTGKAGLPLGTRRVILEGWSGPQYDRAETTYRVVKSLQPQQGKPQAPQPPQPPSIPGAPETKTPPPGEKGKTNEPSPGEEKNLLIMPITQNLYVYYGGSYTNVGQTTLGGYLPVYVNMPSGGLLWLYEYYWSTGSGNWQMWLTSGGWKKRWFYGDIGGWHSIIANINGMWTNWIHIYVGPGGPPTACSVSPISMNFGTMPVGSSSTKTFTITNTGGGMLSGSVTETCPDFDVPAFSYHLSPGASKAFTVNFTPSSSGWRSCTIHTSSPCGNVHVSGTGGAPPTGNKYAVLISGGVDAGSNYARYLNDITEIRRTLRYKYGYSDANIYVLYADGPGGTQGGPGWVDYSATRSNTLMVFSNLQSIMTSSDQLFVYTTNHGGQIVAGTDQARIWLWNYEFIEDWRFTNAVNPIPGEKYFVFEQCYSGGMIDNLQGPNKVIATAANWNQPSYACDGTNDYGDCGTPSSPNYSYDEFVLHWTAAVRGRGPGGTPVNADSDHNGRVEMDEAFNYALLQDTQSESPQYSDPSGIGGSSTL